MTTPMTTRALAIDQLAEAAERAPQAPVLPGRNGDGWKRLTNAEAWARSGAVASWLIGQGFGPGARSLAVQAEDSPHRVVLLLGALRAGALVVADGGHPADPPGLAFKSVEGHLATLSGIAFAALAGCSIDASVAERRRHIDVDTPARLVGHICQRHGELAGVADAIALPSDGEAASR
ncbi:MAG: AMP-binding protein [Reyranellales bacterium]